RLGRERRVRVEVERVVAEEDADVVRVILLDLLERRDDAAAERALEVGELDDVDLGRRRALAGALERHSEAPDAVVGGGGAAGLGGRGRRRLFPGLAAAREALDDIADAERGDDEYSYGSFAHGNVLFSRLRKTWLREERRRTTGAAAAVTR